MVIIFRPPFNIDVTCMKQGILQDLISGFNFIVMLNGFTYGFQEVSNLETNSWHYESFSEGGVNDHPLYVGTNNPNVSSIVLKRGIILSDTKTTIRSAAKAAAAAIPNNLARKTALLALASLESGFALEHGPALGIIQVYDKYFKQDVMTFSFFSLGMSEWRMSGLDAMNSGNLLLEEMTIIHLGLKKLSTKLVPSFSTPGYVNRFKGADAGYYYDAHGEALEARRAKSLENNISTVKIENKTKNKKKKITQNEIDKKIEEFKKIRQSAIEHRNKSFEMIS